MERDNNITVTHFINPHLFWYKTIDHTAEQFHVINVFEQNLLELYKNKPSSNNFLRPQIGDKVAVNFIAWNKFIRAEILERAEFQQQEYIVWALDYGFPLLTKKEYIRILPSRLQDDISHVQIAGIANICPAEQEYDDAEGNLVMIKKDKWLQKTCNVLEKLLADSISISFFKHYQTDDNHVWGDLIITNYKGIEINARDYLLKTINAIREDEFAFKETCSKFKTTKISPWLSNDRNTKMKINNIKHNYIEHINQKNATLVDENAKRKVKDWQKRNERKEIGNFNNIDEVSCGTSEDSIDNITFDDSVSVVQNHKLNYIGKAGILTKIKQKKYSSDKDLPPSALPEFFEVNNMPLVGQNLPTASQNSISSTSGSTYDSSHLEDFFQLSIKENVPKLFNKEKDIAIPRLSNIHNPAETLIDFNSIASSKASSRKQNLFEMRKKVARFKKEEKINKSIIRKPMSNQNETTKSILILPETSDRYPYQSLDKSLSLSPLNNTSVNNMQLNDNKSELSVQNKRVKKLIAMRQKFDSSTNSSSNSSQIKTTVESPFHTANNYSKEDVTDKNNMQLLNTSNLKLKPKSSKSEDQFEPLHQIYSVPTPSKSTVKEILKFSQTGYNSHAMVPAGFDITRLQTYKDEKNHWHRKKTTRYDYVPHEQTSSTEELFSSKEIGLTSESLCSSNSKKFYNGVVMQSSRSQTSSIEQDSSTKFELKKFDENNLSSEISTSSNLLVSSKKMSKSRRLKSPTSQLLKIEKILHEHSIEKEQGNTNLLDLNQLNTNFISQKPLFNTTSSNVSIKPSSNFNNCCSPSSLDVVNTQNEKVYKYVSNYDTFVDVKHSKYLPLVEGERKIQTKFIDHLVLAHSSIQLTPIENISEAAFLPEIHEEMRQMRVNKVYRIQVYSWSHVLRNNSLFVVNAPRSGKTWSYLPPLCSLLCCRKDFFKPSYGPVAIILVASLKHVELVDKYCRRLMQGLKAEAPTCIASCGLRNLIETKIHLLNGCGILVATPSNILRLLRENENEPLFDAERLQHIVIDDMDIMMSRSQQDFKKACSILFKMGKKSNLKKLLPQLIVTSRDWDGLMVKFIRKSSQPLLLMGDFLEAAVYGHTTLSVKLKANTKKNSTILKFIKEVTESAKDLNNRTLIMCNEDEDVQHVYKFLQDCGYPCLCFYSRSTESERITIDEWKRKVSSQILICTDARFYELKIQNVNNLIHYSMPTSWTQFTLRFSAFARTYSNYVCLFEHNILSTKDSAHSMILLDENNNLQLPRLVAFLCKHNQIVQDEIKAVAKRVLIMGEERRILNTTLLCPQLLEFGECDEVHCNNRHELTQFDVITKSDCIPCSGEIRIHVLKVFSPTHYAVRLLNHKLPNTKKWSEIRRSSEALTFSIQLNMHYSDEKNLFLHWPPQINDLCIYQYAENFRRASILEAQTLSEKESNIVQTNLKVTLRLIDDGIVISSVKCSEIFVCDEKFKGFPPQAIDVRLMQIVPFDNERNWDYKSTKQVQKWIVDDVKSNYVVQASIDFSLANTIWVKNVEVMEKLAGIDAYCPIVNLKKSLVEKNFGILYSGDRKHVRDLAEEYGFLNSFGIDTDNGDSEFDYQSCKNESINLIRFSSSNDESTNSVRALSETSLEQIRNIEDKSIELERTREKTKPTVDEFETLSYNEGDEAYIPNKIKNPNKDIKLIEYKLKQKSAEQCNDRALSKETWSELTLNKLVKVEIGDEEENGNWENIFLQIIDKKSTSLFEELNKLIVKHVENIKLNKENQKKLYDFEPLHNCIVRYNNLYLRAKIFGVYGEHIEQRLYKFFLCDYACFTNAKTENLYNDFLYETTEEITTFTPYQAIHCTLAGIKWDNFISRYRVTKDYLYAFAVLECDSYHDSGANIHNLPMHSYKILLYECEKEDEFSHAVFFNKALVDNGITIYDEETKHFLEYKIGIQQIEEIKTSNTVIDEVEVDVAKTCNKDDVLTYEQLLDLIKSHAFDIEMDDIFTGANKLEVKSLKNNETTKIESNNILKSEKNKVEITKNDERKMNTLLKANTKVPTSVSEIDGQGHCTSYSNSGIKSSISLISTDISNCSDSESSLPRPPALKVLYKRPLTTWYQNDCMIFLSIHAPDVKVYLLEVSSKTILFTAEIQSEKSVIILNLLGSIEPKSVSHEIKGLNVVIRLKKTVFVKWPRLLKESTKYPWLKYNFDAFDSIEMEYIVPQQILHTILDNELNSKHHQTDTYYSDEDNEYEMYQTYNPIENNDECDLFSAF